MDQHSSLCCQQLPLPVAAEDMRVCLSAYSANRLLLALQDQRNLEVSPTVLPVLMENWNSLLNTTPEDCQGKTPSVAEMNIKQSAGWLQCEVSSVPQHPNSGPTQGKFSQHLCLEFHHGKAPPSVKESHSIPVVLSSADNYCQQTGHPSTTNQPGPHHGDC